MCALLLWVLIRSCYLFKFFFLWDTNHVLSIFSSVEFWQMYTQCNPNSWNVFIISESCLVPLAHNLSHSCYLLTPCPQPLFSFCYHLLVLRVLTIHVNGVIQKFFVSDVFYSAWSAFWGSKKWLQYVSAVSFYCWLIFYHSTTHSLSFSCLCKSRLLLLVWGHYEYNYYEPT